MNFLNKMENKDNPLMPRPGDEYVVPSGGSLGLLALGYKGILIWKKKREEYRKTIAGKKKPDEPK